MVAAEAAYYYLQRYHEQCDREMKRMRASGAKPAQEARARSDPVRREGKGRRGLRTTLPYARLSGRALQDLKNDLSTFNDDSSWTLPMPARCGQDGITLHSELKPDYTRRPEPEGMIKDRSRCD
jgi:hypothetical protein